MAKLLMKGCEAAAEAAVRGGCRFFAGYPITPQSALPEYLSKRLPEVGGCFIQGESEVASINMVFGAASGGTRSMTSSAGLGISLKSEGVSHLCGARVPAVIVNVCRAGPGFGSIQPAQTDYYQMTKALGHGGHRMIVFAPNSVQETVDMIYESFDLAEKERNPVAILMDGSLGQIMEEVELPPMKELSEEKPDWALGNFKNGPRASRHITSGAGSGGNAGLEKRGYAFKELYERWAREYQNAEEYLLEDAEYVLVAYGMPSRVCKYAACELRKEGLKVGVLRPRVLYPFPKDSFQKLDYSGVKAFIDVEMAIPAQLYDDIALEVRGRAPIMTFGHTGGITISNEEAVSAIRQIIGGVEK